MVGKLSPTLVKSAAPGTYGDGGGLWLRVSKTGRRTWFFQYAMGKQRKAHTFAEFPAISLREARQRVIKLRADLRDGIDPNVKTPTGQTVATAVELHIEEHCNQLKSGRNPARVLRNELSAKFGSMQITDVTAAHVRSVLARIEDRGASVEAQRAYAYMSKFFIWCMRKKGWIVANPMDLIEKPTVTARTRDRVLTDAEVASLWTSMGNTPGDAIIQMLLLTGARRGEIANLKWDDVDLDHKLVTFVDTKNGTDRTIPLSPSAFAILNAQPVAGDFIFSTMGTRPYSGFSQLLTRVQRDSDTSDWRIHDLRRTCGTGLQRLGVDRDTIKATLGHKQADVTAIYLRHDYLPEIREALTMWDAHIQALLTPDAKLRA
ncbi:Integrase [Ruegeria sp. THAF57]|uniref:tyrosine-type recombinase/integrase n=1 Tax=Ruegeria sp. THAF57 TaxID=2744555 RepID=UPI0015DF90C1|nr:site-specific integrase [Ruegeria sp. THAF57]CAD0183967.1 Integrase [Ruegeria sp. THAF57]